MFDAQLDDFDPDLTGDQPAAEPSLAATDAQAVLATVQGRRFVHRLLAKARLFHLSYTGEAISTAFNEGQRNVGLAILAELRAHDPARTEQMLREGGAA